MCGQAALDQPVQVMAHVVGVGEAREPLAARVQLAQRLRAAQQQADQGNLLAGQIQHAAQAVFVALGTRAKLLTHQAEVFQLAQRVVHHAGLQIQHRLARGLLIRGHLRSVDGERVRIRRGGLFFDQTAEHAGLGGVEDGRGRGLCHGWLRGNQRTRICRSAAGVFPLR
ncbi:hypothetical protein IXO621_03905 [Xanthomonas oryzae pv. oryzae]|nr:hypothetical protein IXO621_03905 [Xanthomonas oryzae pv. oryzae]